MYHPKVETQKIKQKIHQSKVELQERINKGEREREREQSSFFFFSLEENVRQIKKMV